MLKPGELPRLARWGYIDQSTRGGSTNLFGDAGVDTVEEGVTTLVHRIGQAGDVDVSEVHFEVRGPGEPRGTKPVRTLRFDGCDRVLGLSDTETARLRAEVGNSTIAPNIDVVVTFERG